MSLVSGETDGNGIFNEADQYNVIWLKYSGPPLEAEATDDRVLTIGCARWGGDIA